MLIIAHIAGVPVEETALSLKPVLLTGTPGEERLEFVDLLQFTAMRMPDYA